MGSLETKKCIRCDIEKELDFFPKDRREKTGHSGTCKFCTKEYKKEYYIKNKNSISIKKKKYKEENREKIKESMKSYYEDNKEYLIDSNTKYNKDNKEKINYQQRKRYAVNKNGARDKKQKYYKDNIESINRRRKIYNKKKKETDPLYKLYMGIRGLIITSIKKKGYSKKSRTFEILGCSFEEFQLYIESKFESWMTWENHGQYTGNYNETWQFDHIIPIDSAKTEEEIINLNHYTNFQPLCSRKNQVDKKNRLDY